MFSLKDIERMKSSATVIAQSLSEFGRCLKETELPNDVETTARILEIQTAERDAIKVGSSQFTDWNQMSDLIQFHSSNINFVIFLCRKTSGYLYEKDYHCYDTSDNWMLNRSMNNLVQLGGFILIYDCFSGYRHFMLFKQEGFSQTVIVLKLSIQNVSMFLANQSFYY